MLKVNGNCELHVLVTIKVSNKFNIEILITLLSAKRKGRNDGMRGHHDTLLVMLCTNMLFLHLGYILFAFVQHNDSNHGFCIAIGMLLHFFILSTFVIMMSMAILRYILVHFPFTDKIWFNNASLAGSIGK